MKTKYSVIGLGKLGGSMAAAIASRGFEVIGTDVNENVVKLVNDGHAPAPETGLEELVAANRERLRATTSHEEAVHGSDVSFVIVPTPSNDEGAFSIQYATWAFREIGRALKTKKGYHNIVLTSTVLPGATRYGLLPILEKESGKKCGPDFGLCYTPEFIALGSIIRDFLNPDLTLLGQFDDKCGEQLEACFKEILENPPPCQRMTLENAELTKIAVNTFVTTKITFANMLAEICETIPGGNIDVISAALGQDKRIGRSYLTGALGYGGRTVSLADIRKMPQCWDCPISLNLTSSRNRRPSTWRGLSLLPECASSAMILSRMRWHVPSSVTRLSLSTAWKIV